MPGLKIFFEFQIKYSLVGMGDIAWRGGGDPDGLHDLLGRERWQGAGEDGDGLVSGEGVR